MKRVGVKCGFERHHWQATKNSVARVLQPFYCLFYRWSVKFGTVRNGTEEKSGGNKKKNNIERGKFG